LSNRNKQKAYLALTATSIIWGTTWVASKFAVQSTPGLEVSYLRQFIAGTLLLSFFLIKGEKLPTWPQFRWLFMVSIFMFVVNNGFGTWSLKYIPSGLGALMGALYPLFVVIIELLFLKSKNYNVLTFAGLFIGLAGITIVFYANAFHEHPPGYIFGISLCATGMLCWSIGTILIARNKYRMNPYYAMGWQMFMASFLIYLMAVFTGNNIPLREVHLQTWAAIAYLVIAGSMLAFMAFIYTLKYLPPAVASLFAYINPIVAILLGSAIFTDEILTLNVLIGAIITVLGVYLVNNSVRRR
jgi:drug/metabolite transporter (DMT)-like permease